MYQSEAMWISFDGGTDAEPLAVKISAGGVNALTGLAQDAPSDGRQNYLALTGQLPDSQL